MPEQTQTERTILETDRKRANLAELRAAFDSLRSDAIRVDPIAASRQAAAIGAAPVAVGAGAGIVAAAEALRQAADAAAAEREQIAESTGRPVTAVGVELAGSVEAIIVLHKRFADFYAQAIDPLNVGSLVGTGVDATVEKYWAEGRDAAAELSSKGVKLSQPWPGQPTPGTSGGDAAAAGGAGLILGIALATGLGLYWLKNKGNRNG